MKKIMLVAAISLPLFAQSANFFEVGAGAQNVRDNFDAKAEGYSTSYDKSNKFGRAIPYVNFEFNYNNFIAKTVVDELLLGYKIDKFTVGLSTNVLAQKRVWEDPYALGSSKSKTKLLKNGAYLSYSLIENDDYTSELTYSYSKYKIKNDHSISSLKRDANNHQLRSDNVLNSNILFNFAYDIHNADGKASSYDKYSLGLGYIYEINDSFDVTFLGNIGQTSYKETKTMLNKKIKSTDTEFVVSGTFKNPFGFNDKYLKLILVDANENANHDFYDKRSQSAILSMGFNF